MRELYSRQSILDLKVPSYATVFGVGGIGTWVAITLAMSGVSKIDIWDSDHVELSNLARLPYPLSDIGKRKVDALTTFLLSIRPELNLTALDGATEHILSILTHSPDVVFDCTDNSESQKIIVKWCRRRGIDYVKAGCDGLSTSVTNNYSGWDIPSAPQGYTVTPSWVVPVMITAGFSVLKALRYPQIEIHGNLGTVKLSEEGGKQ